MTEIVKTEGRRILDSLKGIDTNSAEYQRALANFEYLCGIASLIEDFELAENERPHNINIIKAPAPSAEYAIPDEQPEVFETDAVETDAAPDTVEEQAEEVTDENVKELPTEEEVRAALVDIRRKKGTNIAELIRSNFGVSSFNALPAMKYPELLDIIHDIEAS